MYVSPVGATGMQTTGSRPLIITRKSWVMGHVGHGQFTDGSARWVVTHCQHWCEPTNIVLCSCDFV